MVVLVLAVLGIGVAGSGMMGPGMMGYGGYGYRAGGFGLLFMALFWLLVIAGVVVVVVWLAGAARNAGTRTGAAGMDHALEVLRERYARGEITLEQYEQIRHELEKG